jgi:methanol metabolism-related c-type cytochrome
MRMNPLRRASAFPLAAVAALFLASSAIAESTKGEDGKWRDEKGNPTYHIEPDGTVDWYTYSGFKRYHDTCHVCHGPDGLGSTYAPSLVDSLKNLSYEQFAETVINGKKSVNAAENLVMPAFGTNKNVFCYLDDIYIYLKARSDGVLPRARPAKHEPAPKAARDYETQCMGF